MSVSSTRGRGKKPLSQSLGRSSRWIRISESSKGSGGSSGQHFDDPFSLSGRSGRQNHSHGQVFTVDSAHLHHHQHHKPGSMRYTHSHILRYGTTRSMPETPGHHDHDQHDDHDHDHNKNHLVHLNGKVISNGSATTGRRLYSSNPRGGKLSARRVFFNSGSAPGHFVRRGVTPEKKEDCISFFDIEMDKSPFYQYRPGEEISGSVHMDIRHNLEIRYVELVIVGHGTTTVLKSLQNGLPNTSRESYLRKNTCVIGTSDALWSSMLTPGHYVSKFRFRLPKDLPSSLQHDDLSSGFKMDIGYYIKARICDDVPGSVRSNTSTGHHHHHPRNHKSMVKVLLSRKHPFRVQRPFDINLVPGATTPVTHTEEVYLSCAGNNLVVVTLNLERAVFLAGDDIKLHLSASVPASQRIKIISCRLQQHLTLDHRHSDTITFTLSKVERSDPQATSQGGDETSYDVTLPTQTNLVTSFLHGCSMLRISYTLDIEMRFVPAGGKLSFTIPLGIGPCAEPIYAEKISSRKAVPIFNRPTRFPCFSPASAKPNGVGVGGGSGTATRVAGSSSSPAQMDVSSRSSQSINVVTKYSNSLWAKCFLCCFTSDDVN